MPVPLPAADRALMVPPDAAEARHIARGILSAVEPPGGLTQLQGVLLQALSEAMLDYVPDLDIERLTAEEFAEGLARRSEMFRTRILQVMLLGALVLRPIPVEVTERIEAFARELSVDDGMLEVVRHLAEGSLALASFDFERSGYTADWAPERASVLHTSAPLAEAWEQSVADDDLAARWRQLAELAPGTLGRGVWEFYLARGFQVPGTPGSAPPLLAQHDWVHVLADYGSTVESEIEVFAFIARANDDPQAFSLLAMVVSLFETGYLERGAGLFEAFPGQLSRDGVAVRLAEATRRGALVDGSVDFLGIDWFTVADQPVEVLRERFGIEPKSARALAAGSVSPWGPGGISPFQLAAGREAAARHGRVYDSFGASVA